MSHFSNKLAQNLEMVIISDQSLNIHVGPSKVCL